MSAKVLIVGGGGREHALAWKISQSPRVDKIFTAPGNAGTDLVADNVDISFTDAPKLLQFAVTNKIDLTVIGQEAATDAGVVDAFKQAGLTIFGPTKAATKIESSKAFSKNLMKAENIPTADYRTFDDAKEAELYIKDKKFPLVIKASGLAEGKGAIICETLERAKKTIDDIMIKKIFKEAGSMVVIEDFLNGQEVSIHALSDGNSAVLFPASQDHKQVFDGDKGPNTGGIGVIAPVPWVTGEHLRKVENNIVRPALRGLTQKNMPFIGCLYPGLMIDGENIHVIEFNARFGDPEAEVYMRLLNGDLFEIFDSSARGKLDPAKVTWNPGYAVSVALCSKGYPGKYEKSLPISGIEEAEKMPDVVIFHAGTIRDDNGLKSNGGRVLHVTATAASLEDVRRKVYAAIKLIHFDGMHYRTDIGLRVAPAS